MTARVVVFLACLRPSSEREEEENSWRKGGPSSVVGHRSPTTPGGQVRAARQTAAADSSSCVCLVRSITSHPHSPIPTPMQQQQLPAVAHPDPPLDRSDAAASSATQALPSRNASSKYDFVKVKVWLGENADHYYVLSRFLLSRMLTVTKVKSFPCRLVTFATSLASHMLCLATLVHRFLLRKPLSILTTNDTDYNMQTDMDYELLRTSTDAPLTSVPVWARDFNSPEELITEFCRECRVVRKGEAVPRAGLPADREEQTPPALDAFNALTKSGGMFVLHRPFVHTNISSFRNELVSTSISLQGIHLDPSIYLMDEEKRDDNSRTEKTVPDSENSGIFLEMKEDHQSKNGIATISPTKENENLFKSKECTVEEGRISEELPYAESHKVNTHDSVHSQERNPKDEIDGHKDLDQPKNKTGKKDKPPIEPIVVPIVLRMSDFDHKALLEEWIATRAFRDNCLPQVSMEALCLLMLFSDVTQDLRKLINNLKLIQDYLCSFESQGLTIVDMSANSFPQTLDWLHSYLLQCIERRLLAACSESCNEEGN
ncbi:hypothetical protein HU200_013786 [Digitaria exilis]|uniref:Uncharacterized protein n=1 Tax=Digitaria exilis TaxID=1010633 RepID=A0A835FDY6_9POAL|nr:hypothetical protein HU200_013786 [Digitaria exilis]